MSSGRLALETGITVTDVVAQGESTKRRGSQPLCSLGDWKSPNPGHPLAQILKIPAPTAQPLPHLFYPVCVFKVSAERTGVRLMEEAGTSVASLPTHFSTQYAKRKWETRDGNAAMRPGGFCASDLGRGGDLELGLVAKCFVIANNYFYFMSLHCVLIDWKMVRK